MATLPEAIQKFAESLAQRLEAFAADIASLEVRTYTVGPDDVQVLVNENLDMLKSEGKLRLRAYTQIAFDGDTILCVPETEQAGEVDTAIWELHQTAVRQAMISRATMVNALGEATASVMQALREAGQS